MLMKPDKFLHFQIFHQIGNSIVGQTHLWLDPPYQPVNLAIPLDPNHVLLSLPHPLHCNQCEDDNQKGN